MCGLHNAPALPLAGRIHVDDHRGFPHVPLTGPGLRIPHLQIYAEIQPRCVV